MEFTFKFYSALLYELKKDFIFSSFEDFSEVKRIFLRHDIDIFIENAENFGKIENDLGIKAIYFFQPNNEFYNPISPRNLSILERLSLKGHYLGLHVDCADFKTFEELEDNINKFYDFYVRYLPITKIISFHKPPQFVMDNFEIKNFLNVYGDKYFKQIRYFSDSKRREFSHELFESIAIDKTKSIQLLTHPYWWDHISLDLFESWERYLKIKNELLEKTLKKDFEPYRIFFDGRLEL